jgi:hypothetical protein
MNPHGRLGGRLETSRTGGSRREPLRDTEAKWAQKRRFPPRMLAFFPEKRHSKAGRCELMQIIHGSHWEGRKALLPCAENLVFPDKIMTACIRFNWIFTGLHLGFF